MRTNLLALTLAALLSVPVSIWAQPTSASNPPIAVSNTSRYVGDGRYDWTVFVYGTLITSDQIRCVEYTLHPTFPNPVRRVCTRGKDLGHAFALNSNGWGEFMIELRVFFRNGKEQRLSYALKLRQ